MAAKEDADAIMKKADKKCVRAYTVRL